MRSPPFLTCSYLQNCSGQGARVWYSILWVVILVLLLCLLASTADDYFCVVMDCIVEKLHIPRASRVGLSVLVNRRRHLPGLWQRSSRRVLPGHLRAFWNDGDWCGRQCGCRSVHHHRRRRKRRRLLQLRGQQARLLARHSLLHPLHHLPDLRLLRQAHQAVGSNRLPRPLRVLHHRNSSP